MINTTHKPGTLINYRGRDWIVMPSEDTDVLTIKPLGGSDEELTGIYLPLTIPGQNIKPTTINYPTTAEIGAFETAKILFHASRLSFRNASGPFRCMGKLSFRPRSYQVVPLVMALKQDVTRLLIADDVGIGKTIEALMILKEAMERGEIKRFAVICLPHLCEQWKSELKDKLDINAEIIRSSTISSLERQLPDLSTSVFNYFPYQVISIDYIKQSNKKGIFLNDCPEFIIVDEAHTCAKPAGARSNNQQQRYSLLFEIAQDKKRHMLLLTATPHSGKDDEFRSLLGLVNTSFNNFEFENITPKQRQDIASHFVQRKRSNIKRWLNQDTPFPQRETKEIGYKLTAEYFQFYNEILAFAQNLTRKTTGPQGGLTHYWAALALLRGVMSSPLAGLEMLKARKSKEKDFELADDENPLFRSELLDSDITETDLMEQVDLENEELSQLDKMIAQIEELMSLNKDRKAAIAVDQVKEWVKKGANPIIFCRYIATAKYLGEIMRKELPNTVDVQTITSEFADEQRKEMIDRMGKNSKRVLIATDCLSEGINLQQYFTAVLHYDLPWNPNRLEQREGRVDRYGQSADLVYAYLLWGEDNPIDNVVLKVLIKKVREIQKATGVSIVIGDDNQSIMDSVLKEVLLDPKKAQAIDTQTSIDFGDEINEANKIITNQLEQAKEKAEKLRTIFSHESINPQIIETELKEVDEVIGDVNTVAEFVANAVRVMGASMVKKGKGYELNRHNLPDHIKRTLPDTELIPISFESPTPKDHIYIGRNHKLVEFLSQSMMAQAFDPKTNIGRVARSAVIQTDRVASKTVIVQFRVRNVIKEAARTKEIIAEEMYLWGYSYNGVEKVLLDYTQCKTLLLEAESQQNLTHERQQQLFLEVAESYPDMKTEIQHLSEVRAEHLVEAHGRFKELVGGRRYEAVYPVLPPDVMGVYVLLPKPKIL